MKEHLIDEKTGIHYTLHGDNITEQLKATDQMEWVRRMNTARAAVTEIVNSELIYR